MKVEIKNEVFGSKFEDIVSIEINWKTYERWSVVLLKRKEDGSLSPVKAELFEKWRDVVKYLGSLGVEFYE